jgi:SAM-dependent methyltransferase
MPHGTLANLANSAFVRTPPALAERIARCLLSFPQDKSTTILDPTAGEGDLLVPCRDIPQARLYGVEISAERTAVARERLPQAELVPCAFEGISIPKASMSLVLANPPYFFQDGKRAEYRILADAGTLLLPGGVLVAILPARSAWDGALPQQESDFACFKKHPLCGLLLRFQPSRHCTNFPSPKRQEAPIMR